MKPFAMAVVTCLISCLISNQVFSQVAGQEQELDPIKAEALAVAQGGPSVYAEPTPAEVEAYLRSQGVEDPQTEDVQISEFNFPIGFFNMGPTDFILVKIHRDRLPQFAEVFYNGERVHSYWVSTGSPGRGTPAVTRTVYERNWNRVSKKYRGSMTGAMMFYGGYGLHMTPALSQLGRPASHGCVRMEDAGIYMVWKLASGTPNANITIQILAGKHEGVPPEGKAPYQGGKLQKIEDTSGKPAGGKRGAMGI